MKGGTLFSGIGAPEAAMPWVDWRWCAEIERFPSAVHKHRFPHVPNLGDVNKVDWNAVERVGLLVAGSPCQSFSVAGKRLGLDDPRGNLALVTIRIAQQLGVDWLVFENVPGLLSSDGGRDFAAFLYHLTGTDLAVPDTGWGTFGIVEQSDPDRYGAAYCVLDAQYFGVAQRRRRVFVVAHLGDWRPSAAVLLEPTSLRGDHPPRREARERVAGATTRSFGERGAEEGERGALIDSTPDGIAGTVSSKWAKGTGGPAGDEAYNLVAHALRADGFDASEDGTGHGTPLVPMTFDHQVAGSDRTYIHDKPGRSRALTANKTLAVAQPLAFPANLSGTQNASTENLAPSMGAKNPTAVAFSCKDYGNDAQQDVAPTLRAMGHDGSHANAGGQLAGAFESATEFLPQSSRVYSEGEAAPTLQATGTRDGNRAPQIATAMQVRRLTPRECERLQGFADDWTLIPVKKVRTARLKSPKKNTSGVARYVEIDGEVWQLAADGPRYKACGNSMAVPVVAWIGDRLRAVNEIVQKKEDAA